MQSGSVPVGELRLNEWSTENEPRDARFGGHDRSQNRALYHTWPLANTKVHRRALIQNIIPSVMPRQVFKPEIRVLGLIRRDFLFRPFLETRGPRSA